MTLLAASLFLSLDSLIVSFALAPVIPSWRRRFLLASLFGLCDGSAFALGAAVRLKAWEDGIFTIAGPLALVACGGYVLIAANWTRFRVNPLLFSLLPILLSLDNLAYGTRAVVSSFAVTTQAAVLGVSSLGLSLVGFEAYRLLSIKECKRALWFTGFTLVLYSAVAAAF